MGVLDWTGSAFLFPYVALFVLACGVSVAVPGLRRPARREQEVEGADAAAFLAGGRQRVAEAATVRLLATGALEMRGKRFTPTHAARDLPIDGEADWAELERGWHPHAAAVRRRLRAEDLLVDDPTLRTLRGWAALPFALLLGLGW